MIYKERNKRREESIILLKYYMKEIAVIENIILGLLQGSPGEIPRPRRSPGKVIHLTQIVYFQRSILCQATKCGLLHSIIEWHDTAKISSKLH